MFSRRQSGFTFVELIITLVVMGALLLAIQPIVNLGFDAQERYRRAKQQDENRQIAEFLMDRARSSAALAVPTPYNDTGTFYHYAPLDPTDTDFTTLEAVLNGDLDNDIINATGTTDEQVRVYQWVTGLNRTVPLGGVVGSNVTLTYGQGLIYSTVCERSDAVCNTSTADDPPGDSDRYTSANLDTWTLAGDDYALWAFSDFDLQNEARQVTHERIQRMQDAFRAFWTAQQLLAPADSTTNFFPLPDNTGAPNLSQATPINGCHDGWYDLLSANVNVLDQLGLGQAEFGQTAWGGRVEYCQDYEAGATTSANKDTVPHACALRILADVSSAGNPTNVLTQNVFTSCN